ncbi:MAG: carboxypeptidase-like regulatory domain-containing protein [Planctomycetota bacterium]
MPRGTIVVLLVLLALALAAWLLLGVEGAKAPAPPLGNARDGAEDAPGDVELAAAGLAGGRKDAPGATTRGVRLGPWAVAVLVEGPDGSPVADARVLVRATRGRFEAGPFPGPDLAQARTGADGRAHVGELPAPEVILLVTAKGFAPRALQVSLPPPGTQPPTHRVRLWPPGTVLQIVVHAQDGTPVPRAAVFVHDGSYDTALHPPPVFTDSLGNAEAPLGLWHRFAVLVHAPGYLAFRTAGATSTLSASESLDIALQTAREVSGRLVASAPLRVPPDVILTPWTPDASPANPRTAWVEQAPDADGRFRVWASPDEAEGGLKLAINSPSHGPLGAHDIDLSEPTTNLRLDLTPALRRLGKHTLFVEHADGRPARGLLIETLVSLTNGGRFQVSGVLDDIGRAELPWPPDAEELDTLVVRDGHGVRHQLRAEDRIDGVWSLRTYGTAHGFVAEADGSRPEHAVVGFYPGGIQDVWRFQASEQRGFWRPCDARGEFTCIGLEPGRYYVLAGSSSAELPPALEGFPVIEVKAGEVTEVGTVTLPARRVVSGRVRDAGGRAVPGIRVFATVQVPRGTVWSAQDETDEEGGFRLEIGREGRLRVFGSDPRWKEPYIRSRVDPEVPIEITLADTPLVVVRFQRRTPPDGASAKLCLSPVGAPQTHTVGGTIISQELRVHLPANLEPDTAYEAWVECGEYLGDITALPTDLSGPGPHVVTMWTRLPEDDDE